MHPVVLHMVLRRAGGEAEREHVGPAGQMRQGEAHPRRADRAPLHAEIVQQRRILHVAAQHGLAQDFLKAGLLDRAEDALHKLEGTRYQDQAWLTLLTLHERSRSWPQAADMAARLQQAGQGDFSVRLAHYQCEQAEQALHKNGDAAAARQLLERAIASTPQAARPHIQLAGMLAAAGDASGAFDRLLQLQTHAPQAVPLIASEWVRLGRLSARLPQARQQLEDSYAQTPSIDVADALVQARVAAGAPMQQAREGYVQHMAQEPSLIAASRWLSHEPFAHDAVHATVQRSVEHAVRPLARYRCAACGFEAQGYFWQCPGCQAWESFPPRRIEEL